MNMRASRLGAQSVNDMAMRDGGNITERPPGVGYMRDL
jgi:hypothetical protein